MGGISGFRESFKKPGDRWRDEVGQLDDADLQRLEARLRRSKRTSGSGLGASAVLAVGATTTLGPTAALGIVVTVRRRSCASKKLKVVRQMLAERQVDPLERDFVRDTVVPVVSGGVLPVCAVGIGAGVASMAEAGAAAAGSGAMTGAVARGVLPSLTSKVASGAAWILEKAADNTKFKGKDEHDDTDNDEFDDSDFDDDGSDF